MTIPGKITDLQKVAIEGLLKHKKMDIQEMTKRTIGIIVDSIDLLSHKEATEVIAYGVRLDTD